MSRLDQDKKKAEATSRIQQVFKGYAVRKGVAKCRSQRYKAFHISSRSLTDYPAIFAGNDPDNLAISRDLKMSSPFMLVATGCFRVFEIAATFCDQQRYDLIKSIVVLDNSVKVVSFWRYMKTLFLNCSSENELVKQLRLTELEWCYFAISRFNLTIKRPLGDYQPIFCSFMDHHLNRFYELIRKLCDEIGFTKFRALVLSAEVVPFDWVSGDVSLFMLIAQQAEKQSCEIVVYLSNILALFDEGNFENDLLVSRILMHVSLLRPARSLHSDLFKGSVSSSLLGFAGFGMPTKYYCAKGIGDVKEMASQIGVKQWVLWSQEKQPQYLAVAATFELGMQAFFREDYKTAEEQLIEAYQLFESVAVKTYLGDLFFQRCVLGRLLGISLAKQPENRHEAEGYLDAASALMKQLIGGHEYVHKLMLENGALLSDQVMSSAVQASSI